MKKQFPDALIIGGLFGVYLWKSVGDPLAFFHFRFWNDTPGGSVEEARGIRSIWVKTAVLIVFFAILIYATTGFLRGYFIS